MDNRAITDNTATMATDKNNGVCAKERRHRCFIDASGEDVVSYHQRKDGDAMKLTLIRHGITHGNKYGLYYGTTDLPLLEEGVEELRERRLGYIYPTAPRYYTSPLQRTQQTLRQLYGAVDFTVVDGLREMNFGVFEMRTVEDLRQDEAFVAWSRRMSTDRCPEGESFADVQRRALVAIDPILHGGEDAVCVIHGGVIACLMTKWFPGPRFESWMPHPGTGWQVTVEDGKAVDYREAPFVPVV